MPGLGRARNNLHDVFEKNDGGRRDFSFLIKKNDGRQNLKERPVLIRIMPSYHEKLIEFRHNHGQDALFAK